MIFRRRRRGLYSTRGAGSALSILVNLARIFIPLGAIALLAYFALNLRSTGSGRLRVRTNVPGAEILLGGRQTGLKTDTTMIKLPAGRKIVTVRKQDFVSDPEFAIVPVADDSITSVFFKLTPAEHTLRSDSIPPLSSVRQEIFSTGEPIQAIPPASYRSAPLLDYSHRIQQRIQSSENSQDPDRFAEAPNSLPPEEQPASGEGSEYTSESAVIEGTEVLITSSPEGAHIWVNGGETPRVTPYTFRGLDRGMYIFKTFQDGMIVEPESVVVRLGESYQHELASFKLSPDPKLPKPTLVVHTTPLAAGIKVNGENCGIGQCSKEVAYGSYSIEFMDAPGFRTPEPMMIDLTKDQPHVEVSGEYEKLIGNSYLAILPGEELEKFDPKLLKVYVDNELVLDGPEGKFNVTLVSKVVAGKRLIRVHYGALQNDMHVEMIDGGVSEISFRVESFFSKRTLKLRDKASIPLEKWQERARRLTVLNLG